jgi:hypothetical protein
VNVFKRHYYEYDDTLTEFDITLYNPSGGAEIGYHNSLKVLYYDDPIYMNDAISTYTTLNGVINLNNHVSLLIGDVNVLDIYSNLNNVL